MSTSILPSRTVALAVVAALLTAVFVAGCQNPKPAPTTTTTSVGKTPDRSKGDPNITHPGG